MALPVVRQNRLVRTHYVRPQYVTQFDQVVGAFLGQPLVSRRSASPWSPIAKVTSTDEAYTVDLEVPGLKRSDISIDLAEKALTVSGRYGADAQAETGPEQSEQAPVAEDGPSPSEPARPARTLRTGSFEYRRTLPADVERDAVSATLADGVLTLVLPRVAKPAARRVEIAEG